jgi:hypothetical protein
MKHRISQTLLALTLAQTVALPARAQVTAGPLGATQYVINAPGGVGINTSPNHPLDIAGGTARIRGAGFYGGGLYFSSVAAPNINASYVGRGTDAQGITGFYSLLGGWNLIVTDYGNVGIGTINPQGPLDVVASNGIAIRGASTSTFESAIYGNGTYAGVRGDSANYGLYGTGLAGVNGLGTSVGVFGQGPTGVKGVGPKYGVLGVAFNTDSYGVYSSGKAGGTTGWNQTSDARYKTDVAPLADALGTILGLRGVSFAWRRDAFPDRSFPEGRQVGFLAQEVERLLPHSVSTDQDGYKSVAYTDVVPVLVEAVKALKAEKDASESALRAEMDTLRRENVAKQRQIEVLTARLDALTRGVEALAAQRSAPR